MPQRTLRIVAGIGDLAADDPTLLVATDLARSCGAELHLVHACQIPTWMTGPPGLAAAYPEATRNYERMVVQALENAARAIPGGERAKLRVEQGPAAPVLADAARELGADLLIVGAARGSRLGRALLGTTAQRVLREATVPVLVTRRPVTLPLHRVLVTGDLTPLSGAVHDRALSTITALFGDPGALRALVVLGWAITPPPLTPDAMVRAARAELGTFLRERVEAGPQAEPVVRVGPVADEIVDEARDWDADLLVVGTHARGWGDRMLLGSMAETTLRDAPCNVLAIPPRATAAPREAAEDDEPAGVPELVAAA